MVLKSSLVALFLVAVIVSSGSARAADPCAWYDLWSPCGDRAPRPALPPGEERSPTPTEFPNGPPPTLDNISPPERPRDVWHWVDRVFGNRKTYIVDEARRVGDSLVPRDPESAREAERQRTASPPVFQGEDQQAALKELLQSAPSSPRSSSPPDPKDIFGTEAYNQAHAPVKPATQPPPAAQPPPQSALEKWKAQEAASVHRGFDNPNLLPTVLKPSYTQPGGVVLARAAAERMALNLDIDGAHYSNGMIVLSGKKSDHSIDAALFLTAIRLACDKGGEPYFSLDPPDPAAWDRESKAMTAAGSESYAHTWRSHFFQTKVPFASDQYPALKSELVFRPVWLKKTRFGEILYKADVLLKELMVGESVVTPDTPFRGSRIESYVSALEHGVSLGLAGANHGVGYQGFRLWFDLTPTGDRSNEMASAVVYTSGSAIDLSDVYPKMFVRRHELGQDLPGSDPSSDMVAEDVNARTALYAETFGELQELTSVFRGYVAALKIAQANPGVCPAIANTDFVSSELLATPLPSYRHALVFSAVGEKVRSRRSGMAKLTTVQGGVALRGRDLYTTRLVQKETPILVALKNEVAQGIKDTIWQRDDRRYVALAIDMREAPRKVPIVATR